MRLFGQQHSLHPALPLTATPYYNYLSCSAAMGYFTYWQTLSPKALNFWIHTFSLIAIFFEGYDQGVMGGVK
jgi:hypothetical protein